jgi:hypothetical protein
MTGTPVSLKMLSKRGHFRHSCGTRRFAPAAMQVWGHGPNSSTASRRSRTVLLSVCSAVQLTWNIKSCHVHVRLSNVLHTGPGQPQPTDLRCAIRPFLIENFTAPPARMYPSAPAIDQPTPCCRPSPPTLPSMTPGSMGLSLAWTHTLPCLPG